MSPSILDYAAAYICDPASLSSEQKEARIQAIYQRADELSRFVGANSFYDLADHSNVKKIGQAVEASRNCFDQLISERSDDAASAYAVVHLMSLNLVDGLKASPEAVTVAEVGAQCYALETARQRIGR